MIKYRVKYYNKKFVYVEREFPQETIKRVIPRIEGWDKLIPLMKRSILKEAQEKGYVQKQRRRKANKK